MISQCSRHQVSNEVLHIHIQVGAFSGAPSELKIKSSFGGTVRTKENNFVPRWGGLSRKIQTLSKDFVKGLVKRLNQTLC